MRGEVSCRLVHGCDLNFTSFDQQISTRLYDHPITCAVDPLIREVHLPIAETLAKGETLEPFHVKCRLIHIFSEDHIDIDRLVIGCKVHIYCELCRK